MIVKAVMSSDPIYINPDTSVTEAKAIMNKKKVSKLPVLDANNHLVGIITKNDLEKAGPSSVSTLDMYELGYILSKLKVEKIMNTKVITVSEDEIVEEAARIMDDYRIGCLPVVKDNVLVGIVTESDLFHVFIDMFGTRHAGVRATFTLNEKPGQLARVAQGLTAANGNIVSVVTSDASDENHRIVTCKVTGVNVEQFEAILKESDACVSDIRKV